MDFALAAVAAILTHMTSKFLKFEFIIEIYQKYFLFIIQKIVCAIYFYTEQILVSVLRVHVLTFHY